jgi:uncharacterized membrane-anchored protein
VTHPTSLRVPEMLNKVPEVTLVFWIIKIMSTTVGETGADYLAVHVGLGTTVTGAIMVCFLAAALAIQLRARRYVPRIYWLTVVLVSVVGTQITDALTDKLEISLYTSTVGFAVALAMTFTVYEASHGCAGSAQPYACVSFDEAARRARTWATKPDWWAGLCAKGPTSALFVLN